MDSPVKSHYITDFYRAVSKRKILLNVVKWPLRWEQMCSVRLFMQRVFQQLIVQHFLCVISSVVCFFKIYYIMFNAVF